MSGTTIVSPTLMYPNSLRFSVVIARKPSLDSFVLPYFLRVWLYSSPVLYYADEVPEGLHWILYVNPLGGLLTAWSDVLIFGASPEPWAIGMAAAWAFGIFLAGGLFFISREREFAVRL